MMGSREPGHEKAAVACGGGRGGLGVAASGGGVQRRVRIGRASSSHLAAVAHGGAIAAVPGGGEHAPGHVRVADHRPRRDRRGRGVRGSAERVARPELPAVRVDHRAVVPGRRVPVRLVLRSPGPPGLGVGAVPGQRQPACHRGGHPHGGRAVAAVADGRPPGAGRLGSYLLRLDAASGAQRYVPITVRSASTAGAVVHAQGRDHLAGLQRVGRLRPLQRAARASHDRGYAVELRPPLRRRRRGATWFLFFDQPPIALAERTRVPLAYETDIDLDEHPGLLTGARAVISLGHDEYYSAAMRNSSLRPVTRGRTSPSSARTRCTGISGSSRGSDRVVIGYKVAAPRSAVRQRQPRPRRSGATRPIRGRRA